MRHILTACACAALLFVGCSAPQPAHVWSDEVGRDFISRWPDPDEIHMPGSDNHFTWQAGYIMYAMEKMWNLTGDSLYYDYIRRYVDQQVDEDGNVPDFSPRALDNFAPGYAVLFMYEQTGDDRYLKAARTIREGFDNYPRTDYGLFWHSHSFRSQAWVDGVFMGQIFLARYGKVTGETDFAYSLAVEQMTKIAEKCQKDNGMLLHAWDESCQARWADPQTGLSPEVWSEGMGWYAILLADILDFIPESYPGMDRVMDSMRRMCEGLLRTADPQTGMWCQVVDRCSDEGNWNETSGTGMFIYLLKRAVDIGIIDADTYMPAIRKAYDSMLTKLTVNADGHIDIIDCSSIGVKTSYEDYISQVRDVSQFTVFASFMISAGLLELGD